MRIFYFIVLLSAILFSEILPTLVLIDSDIQVEYEIAKDESSDTDSSEESEEDNIEETRLHNNIEDLSLDIMGLDLFFRSSSLTLYDQSLKKILIPPPDSL